MGLEDDMPVTLVVLAAARSRGVLVTPPTETAPR
jgi:hypothetical protein